MKTSIPSKQNPLRFGGFCTTADSGVTLGFNEYKCFENKKPDWDTIFGRKREMKYLVSLF
jgi:hypothetical protein